MAIQAGGLRERVEVQIPVEQAGGSVVFQKERTVWASVKLTGKKIPYSIAGASGDGVELTMRKFPLDLTRSFFWRGKQLVSVSVDSLARPGWQTVSAAVVHLMECEGKRNGQVFRFPGYLTEKWVKYSQELPMDLNIMTYVLVTPKAVKIPRGSAVAVGGVMYHVQIAHDLAEFYNEYEIVRTVDL